MRIGRICEVCGDPYIVDSQFATQSRHCSQECRTAALNYVLRANGENKTCKVCGTRFYVPRYRVQTAKFCSKECANHGQYEQKEYVCKYCGRTYKKSKSRWKRSSSFCSKRCYNAWLGEKRFSEKEKRQRANFSKMLNRNSNTITRTRQLLKEFFDFECQICGFNEVDYCIDLHHLDENPNNNSVSNLIMLCVICHRKLHQGDIKISKLNAKRKKKEKTYAYAQNAK